MRPKAELQDETGFGRVLINMAGVGGKSSTTQLLQDALKGRANMVRRPDVYEN